MNREPTDSRSAAADPESLYLNGLKRKAELGEKNDCAVTALSIASGVPYDAARTLMASLGRRPRRPSPGHMILTALTRGLGLEVVDVTAVVRPFPRTVMKAGPVLCRGTYLVKTYGHVLAVKDGRVYDWTDGRRHRVKVIYAVGYPRPAGGRPIGFIHPTL